MTATWVVRRVGLAALVGLTGACNGSKTAPPAPLSATATKPAAAPAPPPRAAPTPPPAPVDPVETALAPRKEVTWKSPRSTVTRAEAQVTGTWVGTVGDYGTRTLYMARHQQTAPGPGGTWASMLRDAQVKSNCVWLELTRDHRGERHECAIIDGKPGIADPTDPFSGKRAEGEMPLEWSWDEAARTLHVRFDNEMFVPALDDRGGTRLLRYRFWDATLGEAVGGSMAVQEYLPEHDYKLPVQYRYEVFSGHFVEGMNPDGRKK